MTRILLVEDHPDIALGIRANLEIEGYAVEVAGNGVTALEMARREVPELVILDLMLPELDGFSVLRTLRAEGFKIPVLILTARDEEVDKIHGFRLGADQYVTKPFGIMEILARVEGLLRRTHEDDKEADEDTSVERIGDIEVDPQARSVRRGDQVITLTYKEFELLLNLIRRRGRVASRVDLMGEVWGYRSAVLTRTIDSHIAALRRKLEEDPANPHHILTVRKIGYRVDA